MSKDSSAIARNSIVSSMPAMEVSALSDDRLTEVNNGTLVSIVTDEPSVVEMTVAPELPAKSS